MRKSDFLTQTLPPRIGITIDDAIRLAPELHCGPSHV
jgi:hypothetical protein